MRGIAYLALPVLVYACAKAPDKPQTLRDWYAQTTPPSGIEKVVKPEDKTLTASEIDAKIKNAVDSAVIQANVRAELNEMLLRGEIKQLQRYLRNTDRLNREDAETALRIHKELYHKEDMEGFRPNFLYDFPEPFIKNGVPEATLVISSGN